jgi:hypothetical protein
MDGPIQTANLIPPVVRAGEPTRLKSAWIALAYERLYPLQSMASGSPTLRLNGNLAQPRELVNRPRMAAGGQR